MKISKANTYQISLIGKIEDRSNDNIDVFVTFDNGYKYVATFFTTENIKLLMEKKDEYSLNAGGRFFWASDMIIVREITEENIVAAIDNLINEYSFESAFQEIPDED